MRNKQEQQLHAEGYTFTGIYSSRDHEGVKAQAAALRKQDIPAKVLTKRYESRGGNGTGWSVYIKKEATPPAKASQATIDFYWPEIKQARHAAEARAALQEVADQLAGGVLESIGKHERIGERASIAARLLAMHDAGQLELKKAV